MKKNLKNIIGLSVTSVFLVALIVGNYFCSRYNEVITTMLCGSGTDFSSEDTKLTLENNDQAVQKIAEDGMVLLKNKCLPLDKSVTKINLFGWSSIDSAFFLSGGGSSTATINEEKKVTLKSAFEKEGFEVNAELLEAYKNYKSGRWNSSTTLSDPDTDFYNKSGANGKTLLANAKDFSSTAVVTISRFGSEGIDIPFTQTKHPSGKDNDRHYLELSTEEESLINLVSDNFENVIILINAGNQMELGFLNNDKIDAALLVNYPGQSGTLAIPRIFKGQVNPSGKLTDTYPYDLTMDPSYVNALRNGDHIHYVEDIYVGYKWYETADKENYFQDTLSKNYNDIVQFPFGYGLSYSTFSQEIIDYKLSTSGSGLQRTTQIEVDVKVTNTSKVEGKDIIQLYYTSPYTKGGIEKSAVNLVAFRKTDALKENESKTYKLTFSAYDMASYDAYDKNKNGFAGYELENGEYQIQLMKNSHSLVDGSKNTIKLQCDKTIIYNRDPQTGAIVSNRYGEFDESGKYINDSAYANCPIDGSNAGEKITYLSRNDFASTFPLAKEKNRDIKSILDYANDYVEYLAYESQEKPVQGKTGDAPLLLVTKEDGSKASLSDLESKKNLVWNKDLVSKLGADYNAPEWETLLDQLTTEELQNFVESSGYGNDAAASIGKISMFDYDGPAGFNISVNSPLGDKKSKWTGFGNETLLGQTWSTQMAEAMGECFGKEGYETGINGIYAPGVNLHRSAFNGRNFEYYSEDGVLSGYLAARVIKGAKENGVYCFLKHFVVSEMGPNPRKLNVWLTEQNLRENYLRPFEIAVKNGATAMMTAFNRLGATWTGGNYQLIQGVLRKEWKFKGVVITDWCQGDWDMPVNQGLHAGNDIWLNPANRCNNGINTKLDSSWVCARRSAHNLLYTICNTYYTTWNQGKDIGIKESKGVFRWWIPALVGINMVVVGLEIYFIFALVKKKKYITNENVVLMDYSTEISSINNKIDVLQKALNNYKDELKMLKKRSLKENRNFKEDFDNLENKITIINNVLSNKAISDEEILENDDETETVFFRKSFSEKINTANEEIKGYYNEIKNHLLSYGLTSRISIAGEVFKYGREELAKITLVGKTLKLHLALEPNDYQGATIPVKDEKNKKIYEKIPTMIKVKSPLALKRALMLINDLMQSKQIKQNNLRKD